MTPEIWPVIHLDTPGLAFVNAAIAFNAGCDGVFVIHMNGGDELVTPVASEIKRMWPDKKVGVNYLTMNAFDGLRRAEKNLFDAYWTDESGVRSDGVEEVARNVQWFLSICRPILFFGSVAFKYQKSDPDPSMAAERATRLGMIPTTSGSATGKAPPVEKVKMMREFIQHRPLALASGVTPENVLSLAPYVSHILVSTGISKSFFEFDADKLKALVEELRD
jgi:hypothetical protein